MKILSALSSIFIELISYVPTALGVKLRYHIYKYLFKKTDGFFSIGFGCTITGFRHISLGKNVSISKNSFLYASYDHEVGGVTIGDNFFMGTNSALCGNRGNITIGNNVMIASNCVLRPDNHSIDDTTRPMNTCCCSVGSIIIEDDVWIASNCVILKDVVLKKGSVVAAGAVVNKTFDEYSVIGGVPAKLIKKRK